MKEVVVNKTNRKRPLGRPRTRQVDIVAQDIKNIREEWTFDDEFERETLEGFVMVAMALNVRQPEKEEE